MIETLPSFRTAGPAAGWFTSTAELLANPNYARLISPAFLPANTAVVRIAKEVDAFSVTGPEAVSWRAALGQAVSTPTATLDGAFVHIADAADGAKKATDRLRNSCGRAKDLDNGLARKLILSVTGQPTECAVIDERNDLIVARLRLDSLQSGPGQEDRQDTSNCHSRDVPAGLGSDEVPCDLIKPLAVHIQSLSDRGWRNPW